MPITDDNHASWLDRPLFAKFSLNIETLLWVIILVLAIFSRFYILGARVMSHDENSHVYYSWRFANGQGFAHDPLMHGPIQFHLLALSYFMFGDNDFTARVPAALFSVAAVGFLWFYRRYLGRAGALVGAVLMLISPYMLYYGRYARNEAFIELFGVVTIWAILRYLETGWPRYLYWLTLATVLHFTAKETSFIYTAQAMLFLGAYTIYKITQERWPYTEYRNRFILALIIALVLFAALGGYLVFSSLEETGPAPSPANPTEIVGPLVPPGAPEPIAAALAGLFALAVAAGLYFLVRGYTLQGLRASRPFGALIVLGTLVLPQLAAFPVRWMGWGIPTNASEVMALDITRILQIAAFLVPLTILSIVIGLIWNPRLWLINAAIWYGVFTLFYTSLFTNGAGFFTGMVGSLGYWLEQQGVQRGNQPWYYYFLIQVPVYEYLAALGTLLAFGMAFYAFIRKKEPQAELTQPVPVEIGQIEENGGEEMAAAEYAASLSAEDDGLDYPDRPNYAADYSTADDIWVEHAQPTPIMRYPAPGDMESAPVLPLLGFWAVSSLLAYSIAGEKMPWLTVHIALPAILCAAWALGRLIDATDWTLLRQRHGWLTLLLLPVFLLSFFASLGALLSPTPPFQGQELAQLQATSTFLLSFLTSLVSGAGLLYLVRGWPMIQFLRLSTLVFFSLLAVLTVRTSIQANFYNYDYANELLVYAHSAPGVKVALDQIEEISRRTTDGLGIRVAYDNETSYPYWWYLRDYPNAQYYGQNPSRALRDAPVILVGDANFGKIEPVVANLYDQFDYIRLWWPNQDYYDLTWERIRDAWTDPVMRQALFQIWINRDYTKYGQAIGRDMSLSTWNPAARMRLYIRKDIASNLWNYGAAPVAEAIQTDPFENRHQMLAADQVIGSAGSLPGQFQRPRDLAVASDGSLYVVDSDNHRIQHLSPDGEPLQVWGSFGDVNAGPAAGGSFNQPWGIGLAPDGSVFIADTWNHRVQKFNAQGEFLTMWGYFGQGEQPDAFWGPRDVVVDRTGRVYVTDTGNKRVVVFDGDGNYLTQFGSAGMGPGQFDEPVGLAIDANGLVYVADTWNQRIQVFREDESGNFLPFRSWDFLGWYGQSLDNKPYLAVDNRGSVFATDPEGYRIVQFSDTGEAVSSWGDYGAGLDTFGLPASVAVAPDGSIWVTDAGNSRLMRFVLP
jgi:predicted membrane-bound mannosyltransferase/DNA-binding beta-propeller fold protein YncE